MTTEQEISTTRSGRRRTPSDGGSDRLQTAATHVADRVTDTAQEQVGTRVDSGLTRAGDMLEQVAQAVRRTGGDLRTEQPQVANIADTAAGQVDRAARYLRETDAQTMLSQAERFARQQPAIFVGGAMMLGLVAARFLKASPSDMTGSSGGYGSTGRSRGTSAIAQNRSGGWDPRASAAGSSDLRAVGPGRTTTGAGTTTGSTTTTGASLTDRTATESSESGVLEHGRA